MNFRLSKLLSFLIKITPNYVLTLSRSQYSSLILLPIHISHTVSENHV